MALRTTQNYCSICPLHNECRNEAEDSRPAGRPAVSRNTTNSAQHVAAALRQPLYCWLVSYCQSHRLLIKH
jgi:hypothetical protein